MSAGYCTLPRNVQVDSKTYKEAVAGDIQEITAGAQYQAEALVLHCDIADLQCVSCHCPCHL